MTSKENNSNQNKQWWAFVLLGLAVGIIAAKLWMDAPGTDEAADTEKQLIDVQSQLDATQAALEELQASLVFTGSSSGPIDHVTASQYLQAYHGKGTTRTTSGGILKADNGAPMFSFFIDMETYDSLKRLADQERPGKFLGLAGLPARNDKDENTFLFSALVAVDDTTEILIDPSKNSFYDFINLCPKHCPRNLEVIENMLK